MPDYTPEEVKNFFKAFDEQGWVDPKKALKPDKLLELIEYFELDDLTSKGPIHTVYAMVDVHDYDLETHTPTKNALESSIWLYLFTTTGYIEVRIGKDSTSSTVEYWFFDYQIKPEDLAKFIPVSSSVEAVKVPEDTVLTLCYVGGGHGTWWESADGKIRLIYDHDTGTYKLTRSDSEDTKNHAHRYLQLT